MAQEGKSLSEYGFTLPEAQSYLEEKAPGYKEMIKQNPQAARAYLEHTYYGDALPGGYQQGTPVPGVMHPSAPGEPAVAMGESLGHAATRGLVGGAGQLFDVKNWYEAARHPIDTAISLVKSPLTIAQEAGEGNLAAIPQALALEQMASAPIKGGAAALPRVREMALEHPEAVTSGGRVVGAVGGALGGHALMPVGEELGGIGGAYVGMRVGEKVGQGLVKSVEDRAINQVIEGDRPIESLPKRLLPQLRTRMRAQEQAYADVMARTGKDVEELKIPSTLREGAKQMYEERSRQTASTPSLIKTPEELATEQQRGAAFESAAQGIKPEARLRGMSYAAGRHGTEWVPSKRGIETSVQRSSRILPKIP